MTNGEKFKETFSISQVDEGELYAYAWLPNHDAAEISIDWWNAEYKEPTKNDVPENNVGKIDPVIRDNGVKDELNRVKDELAVASGLEKNSKELEKDFGELDCISREEVLKLMKDNWHTHNGDWAMQESMDDIRALPSVTPQEPRTGHWLMPNKEYSSKIWRKCSCCGTHIEKYSKHISFDGEVHYIPYRLNYCYVCGADMREVEE